MSDETGTFTYVLRAFIDSPSERELTFPITLDDNDYETATSPQFVVDGTSVTQRQGVKPERVGSGSFTVNIFDGASNSGFLQIADVFDDMDHMLSVVQHIAWSFAVSFLRSHWARFVDSERAEAEIRVAVGELAKEEFGDRFQHPV